LLLQLEEQMDADAVDAVEPDTTGSDWRKYIDAVSDKPYYHSKRLRRTTWTMPAEYSEEAARLAAMEQRKTGVTSSRSAVIHEKQGDWICALDPASGDVYYFHRQTKVARWDPPPDWNSGQSQVSEPPVMLTPVITDSSSNMDMTVRSDAGVSEQGGNADHDEPVAASLLVPARQDPHSAFRKQSDAAYSHDSNASDVESTDSEGFARVELLPDPPEYVLEQLCFRMI
jgi:hypothetical protein